MVLSEIRRFAASRWFRKGIVARPREKINGTADGQIGASGGAFCDLAHTTCASVGKYAGPLTSSSIEKWVTVP
jgi:hypothetical protein